MDNIPYTPTLMLETSVFNFYYYGKGKEKMVFTRQLFHEIAARQYRAFTSVYVIDELKQAEAAQYKKMKSLIADYDIKILPEMEEIDRLTTVYVLNEIVPVAYETDARHIATATVNQLDFVISYNMGHIAKTKSMIATGFVNRREGYQQIGSATPKEVIEYDKRRTA
jgi:hypothetical protein